MDRSIQRQFLRFHTRTLEKILHRLASAFELLLGDDFVRVRVMDLEPDVCPVVEEAGVSVALLEVAFVELFVACPILFGDRVAFGEGVFDGDAS